MTNLYSSSIKRLRYLFSEEQNTSFIDMLGGFRGSLALSIVLQHCAFLKKHGEIQIFNKIGSFYGVTGFFILSSFLLTYRLMLDFAKHSHSLSQQCLTIVKFFIRRLFRVYIPFVAYAAVVKFYEPKVGQIQPPVFKYANFSSIITLDTVGSNHLWTITPEIKYYFFGPFFALFMSKTKRLFWVFFALFAIATLYVDKHNYFNVSREDMKEKFAHVFKTRFTVFFKASLMALIYFKVENNEFFTK